MKKMALYILPPKKDLLAIGLGQVKDRLSYDYALGRQRKSHAFVRTDSLPDHRWNRCDIAATCKQMGREHPRGTELPQLLTAVALWVISAVLNGWLGKGCSRRADNCVGVIGLSYCGSACM